MHYLVNRQPQRLSQLLGRLARGEPPDAAWRAVFAEFDPASAEKGRAFEKELEDYVGGARIAFVSFEVAPDVSATERLLSDAEVHALRASLHATQLGAVPDAPALLKAEVDASLRAAPDNAAALWVSPDGGKRARAAVAASPQDWRAWILLARSLPEGDASWAERHGALEKAAALAPDNAGVLNELAWALLQHGDSGQALPVARRAAQIAPWDAAILDTLGAIAADLGQCPAALAIQERATELLPEGGDPAALKQIRQRLAGIRAQCGAGAPAAAQ